MRAERFHGLSDCNKNQIRMLPQFMNQIVFEMKERSFAFSCINGG